MWNAAPLPPEPRGGIRADFSVCRRGRYGLYEVKVATLHSGGRSWSPRFRTFQICPKDGASVRGKLAAEGEEIPMSDKRRRDFIALLGGVAA
jgi:hypothetical protein